MTVQDAFEALAHLAEIAFVGRVILSLCPPGIPGRHGPRDLAATWAASHVIGRLALDLESAGAGLLGLELLPLTLAAPWLLVALARWITLPGAMVPRHEPPREVPGALARVLTIAAPIVVVAAALLCETGLLGGTGLLGQAALPDQAARPGQAALTDSGHLGLANILAVVDAIALLGCFSFALAAARRAPLGRALAVLALAAVLAAAIHSSEARSIRLALGMGSGAAFGAVWLRRGDRRAAILAVIAFAGCGIFGARGALFGAAGLFALWIHAPEPSKRSILLPSLVALAFCVAIGWTSFRADPSTALVFTPMNTAVLVVVALALHKRKHLADARLRAKETEPIPVGRIEPTRVERDGVRDVVLLTLFPMASRGELSSLEGLGSALLPLSPMVLLELGLWLVPAEHSLGQAAPDEAAAPEERRGVPGRGSRP